MSAHPELSLLAGCWELRSTRPEKDFGEIVQLEFTPEGKLTYAFLDKGAWEIMHLTFRVNGALVITNQISSPREEITSFYLRPDGSLQLGFAGTQSVFVRIPVLSCNKTSQKESVTQ